MLIQLIIYCNNRLSGHREIIILSITNFVMIINDIFSNQLVLPAREARHI